MSDRVHIPVSDRCHGDDCPPESIIKIFKFFRLSFRFNGIHDKGGGDEKGEENTIIFDKRRLVKTPGYEILITDIDDVIFFEKDAYMYMTITRGQQKYTYMICDLYRKQEDYVEE